MVKKARLSPDDLSQLRQLLDQQDSAEHSGAEEPPTTGEEEP
jgi:hypothetical protein